MWGVGKDMVRPLCERPCGERPASGRAGSTAGFTLIELMLVISILGILATMALPSLQDRMIRVQVQEALVLSSIAREGVEDYYCNTGRMPADNMEAGLPPAEKIVGNFVKAVRVEHGAVEITLGNRVNLHVAGKTVLLRPAVVKDEPQVPIAWVCGFATVPEGMSVDQENNSSVLPRHLPVDCRY